MNRIRRYSLFLGLFMGLAMTALGQSLPFSPGEKLNYKIRYGFINAASGTLSVEEGNRTFNGETSYRLKAEGQTISALSLLVKVKNRYESYIDKNTLLPYLYTESVREGSYSRDSYVRFDRANKVVNTNKGVFDIHSKTLDVLSTFYYARSLDVSDMSVGQSFTLYYFIDDKEYSMVIKYLGKETIKTAFGSKECLKFTPSLIEGRIFRKDSDMYLWISNDANRVPLKAKVEILVGSLTLELQSYSGLKTTM